MAYPSLNNPTAAGPNSSTVYGVAANGAPVLQIGALSAYTDPNGVASPAETGIRLVDKTSGALIFDTVGIASGIMASLGVVNTGYINQLFTGPVTDAAITGASITFPVPRQLHVLTFYRVVADSSGNFAYVQGGMDGAYDSNDAVVLNGLSYANATLMRLDYLSAGSHTASMVASVDSGQTATVVLCQIKVFQLGN